MANITKKVSWSSRTDECGAAGEETPLLNGSEPPRRSRQVLLARWLTVSMSTDPIVATRCCVVFANYYKGALDHGFDSVWFTSAAEFISHFRLYYFHFGLFDQAQQQQAVCGWLCLEEPNKITSTMPIIRLIIYIIRQHPIFSKVLRNLCLWPFIRLFKSSVAGLNRFSPMQGHCRSGKSCLLFP